MPESAYGPTNNCIGIGNELLKRGHRVVFAAESSWRGKLAALGFEEALVDFAPPADESEDAGAGDFWKEYIKAISPEFRKSTLEQAETVIRPIWEGAIDGAKYCEPELRRIIAEVNPDVIIEDNVVAFPALVTAGKPFVRMVSCNPLEITGPGIAPAYSGLGLDDESAWEEYRAEYERTHKDLWEDFNAWVQEQGAPALPRLEFIHSGVHNIYVYPEELDYTGSRPLGEDWTRVDSAVRETESSVELPEHFLDGTKPLVYFSLGSLGGADVELMQRTVDILATAGEYNFIVSKGPLHEEITLAENMWGAEFLPQTRIIPLVDLVITHGGNNTTTEALHFGNPMILLPLFWDQYDNAQRVHESGYGRRLDTYTCTPEELLGSIAELLGDTELLARCRAAGERIRAVDGLSAAATALENVAAFH
ncbi:nucleotide disphospho-sugar-binding domain-containing protein [Arthrobacter sp. 7Tela_A1]|uniref:nucleotide disphospho-sugar-binding domain-containing protein n=1 Tax=Arthrobacter sp. 7Tela_A1 TaxID=3093745 RepID=UPI003BB5A554